MNVYEKLNQARLDFQTANIKMSGKNSFAGYTYYELSDILPVINVICAKLSATCIVRYEKDLAFLDFINAEKPDEKITFSSPMSEANLKGCHAVQNLGAVETYVKRYLYQACFEIVESDALDATMNPNGKAEPPKQVKAIAKTFDGTVLKGGESTPQEKNEIKTLLENKYPNGAEVFTKEEKIDYSKSRAVYTAQEVIANIKAELQRRVSAEATPVEPQPEIF